MVKMGKDFDFDVFLSHSSKDKPRVRQVAEHLKAAGLRVWLDEQAIAHGDDIYLAVERGLERSRTLLLFLSPAALASDWVGLERSTALFRDPVNRERRFVPVLLEDCTLPDVLKRYKYVDFRTETEESRAALLAAARGEALPPARSSPPPAKKERARTPSRKAKEESRILPFALLSAGSFAAGLLVLWLILEKAELLARFGLTGQLFYVLLLPLGLSAAAFLFGALRSYAVYRGEALGGILELGGPVVLFGLVVLGGVFLPQPTAPFSLTVFVHGKGGVHDLPLRQQGHVILDLGPDRRKAAIGAEGQAFFPGIPPSLRGRPAAVFLEAEGLQVAEGSRQALLEGEVLYLPVERLPFEIRGRVMDDEGRPVAGAALDLRDLKAATDADGSFRLVVPGEWGGAALPLRVTAAGFQRYQADVFSGSHDVDVILRQGQP